MPLLLGWDLLHCPLRAARGQHLAMLNHLPAALLLGFLAPILGATFLCPTVISFDQCQMLIAFWQGWPIWTTVLTLTLFSIRKPATIQSPGGKKQATSRDAGQALHAFAFACAATSHWILCISSLVHLASAGSSPSLVNLILPRLPWSHPKPSSVGEGVLWFLQWDYSIAAVAALIWSVTLWLRAAPHASVRGSARRLVLQLASWSLVSGPCGAAVVLMWKRNRLLSR
ncbi:uncharacterized protein BDW47DRAFT_100448 [Aspergillus candidus]|uniref:Uncharacterized protein n=1 Tax=Aspergillus candidus TaxID=41067 RepID=A0A2I2FKC3_ASPCN|nr:hypothetical protein BDW47DRAFT_100448 [Aspergillus candidus]PLB41071.1 hypothetical protein BDW47DRAFT_100448 [Aspergillus candidus]